MFAYDDTKFTDEKPATIADFFDLEKFPGKRGLRKNPKVNLEFALMADGVPADEVYDVLATDEGVDRAFAKLDTIKDQVVWWEAGAQPPQLLADGEVAMTTAYNGRIFDAIVRRRQAVRDRLGRPGLGPRHVGHAEGRADGGETAWEFIKFSTDTQRLADQSNWISYGPARKSVDGAGARRRSSRTCRPRRRTSPNALQNDFEWWADNQDEMNERFNAWLAKS